MNKKKKLIFILYMAAAVLGFVEAVMAITIPQCIILILVSVFVCWCGYIISKDKTADSDMKETNTNRV